MRKPMVPVEKTVHANDPASYLANNVVIDPSTNLESSFQALATAVVPKFADGCVVDLCHGPNHLLRVGVAHVNPEKGRILRGLMEKFHGHELLTSRDGVTQQRASPPDSYRPIRTRNPLRAPARRIPRGNCELRIAIADSRAAHDGQGMRGHCGFSHDDRLEKKLHHEDLPMAIELACKATVAPSERKSRFEEAREAIRTRDEFLSIASHELKTPITAMKLRTEFALRHLQAKDSEAETQNFYKNFLASTNRQLDQLCSLVDTMLDISRIAHGKLTLEKRPVNLAHLIRDILERSADQLHSSGSCYRVSEKKSAIGNWDPVRIEQLLTNLITNAMKYGRETR